MGWLHDSTSPITPWHFTVSRGSRLPVASEEIGRQQRGKTVYRSLRTSRLTPSSRRTSSAAEDLPSYAVTSQNVSSSLRRRAGQAHCPPRPALQRAMYRACITNEVRARPGVEGEELVRQHV